MLEAEVPIFSTLIDVDMILTKTTDNLKAMMTKSLSFDVVRIQINKNSACCDHPIYNRSLKQHMKTFQTIIVATLSCSAFFCRKAS